MKDIPGGQPHLPQIMAQEQGETMDLLVFLVARVPRRDLSLLWEFTFFNNFATLLIMALL